MAEHQPEPTTNDEVKPISLRENTPNETPPPKPAANANQMIFLVMTAAIFLLAGLFLATLFSSDGGPSDDELQDTIEAIVGTRVAQSQPDNTLGIDPAEMRVLVNEALSTQVAAEYAPGEIREMVDTTVGTQIAALVDDASGDVSQDDVEAMVNEAVGTRVAMLRPTNTPVPPTPTVIPITTAADDDAFRGPADAPVVIVEFSDFQCGYCRRWATETLPQILEAYPDEVKFVYRDFPIFGEDSIRAAMATECAEEQDSFWDMHNILFEKLNQENPPALSEDNLVSFASEMGLNTDDFRECLTSERYFDEIASDYRAADSWGLRGTPGFVINGVVYTIGAQSFDVFSNIIENELAAASAG